MALFFITITSVTSVYEKEVTVSRPEGSSKTQISDKSSWQTLAEFPSKSLPPSLGHVSQQSPNRFGRHFPWIDMILSERLDLFLLFLLHALLNGIHQIKSEKPFSSVLDTQSDTRPNVLIHWSYWSSIWDLGFSGLLPTSTSLSRKVPTKKVFILLHDPLRARTHTL